MALNRLKFHIITLGHNKIIVNALIKLKLIILLFSKDLLSCVLWESKQPRNRIFILAKKNITRRLLESTLAGFDQR